MERQVGRRSTIDPRKGTYPSWPTSDRNRCPVYVSERSWLENPFRHQTSLKRQVFIDISSYLCVDVRCYCNWDWFCWLADRFRSWTVTAPSSATSRVLCQSLSKWLQLIWNGLWKKWPWPRQSTPSNYLVSVENLPFTLNPPYIREDKDINHNSYFFFSKMVNGFNKKGERIYYTFRSKACVCHFFTRCSTFVAFYNLKLRWLIYCGAFDYDLFRRLFHWFSLICMKLINWPFDRPSNMEFSHQIRHTRVYDFESLQVARHCCRKICLPFVYVNHSSFNIRNQKSLWCSPSSSDASSFAD